MIAALAPLLNWRIWAALVVAIALAASHWRAYTRGALSVQTAWDADKLAQSQAALRLIESTARTTQHLQDAADTARRSKNAKIDRLNADLRAALASLSDRPARPTGAGDVPTSVSTGPAPSCTGAQLYRPDADFLVREAARADRLMADLAQCQTAYENGRNRIGTE